MTPSVIITNLDQVAQAIAGARQRMSNVKLQMAEIVATLQGINGKYGAMIQTVADAKYGGDAFTEATKAQLAALTAESIALQAAADSAHQWMAANMGEF